MIKIVYGTRKEQLYRAMEWKRLESPEIDNHKYSQLDFDKEVKDNLSNKWFWNIWTSTCKKWNLDTNVVISKINSKWIMTYI